MIIWLKKGNTMTNKSKGSNIEKGSRFEEDVAWKLSKLGYWATIVQREKHSGSQPGDIIASKNNIFYMIDCKTLENKTGSFPVSRAEFNQISAYKKLHNVGSYNYFYYILWNNDVYVVPMEDIIHAEKSINVNDYIAIWRNFYED